MMRLFVPEPVPGIPVHPLLAHRWSGGKPWRGVFGEGIPNFFETDAVFADTVASAGAVLLPHNFSRLDDVARAYIAAQADRAQAAGIPVFVFAFGDLNDGDDFDPRVRVFRLSVYKSTLGPRDIVTPTTAQSFGDYAVRPKTDTPLVSFCGYAGLKTFRQKLAYHFKNILWEMRALARPVLHARKQGIYWRKSAMRTLARSALVRTNFIVRRSFSGAMSTIELAPEAARAEFIESIKNSDFVLTPKGDGNYSNRFLETLSLGRIPVLIDTDTALPLEGAIDYSKIMVRVPMHDVKNTPRYVREFYDPLTDEEWKARQRLARETFEKYLRQDAFFRNFFAALSARHG